MNRITRIPPILFALVLLLATFSSCTSGSDQKEADATVATTTQLTAEENGKSTTKNPSTSVTKTDESKTATKSTTAKTSVKTTTKATTKTTVAPTTKKPVTTTKKPVITTTKKPVTTTKAPVVTTTTTKKVTTTTKKPVTTTTKKVTTTTKPTTTTTKAPVAVGLKLVRIERPNAYYCKNGQDLLSRVYGQDTTLQIGDKVIYEVTGTSNFTVHADFGCTVSKSGNTVTMTIDGSASNAYAYVKVGGKTYGTNEYRVYEDARNLVQCPAIGAVLKEYVRVKGMTYCLNGTDITNAKMRDNIKIPGNSDWVDEALAAIDNYKASGMTKVTLQVVMADAFDACAM